MENGTSFLVAQTDYDGIGGNPGADGTYFQVSHGWEIAEDTELSVSFLLSSDAGKPNSTIILSQDNPLAEHNLVIGITKSISIGN